MNDVIEIQIVFGHVFSLLIVLQGCVLILALHLQNWLYPAVK